MSPHTRTDDDGAYVSSIPLPDEPPDGPPPFWSKFARANEPRSAELRPKPQTGGWTDREEFDMNEEHLIDKILPRRGIAMLYGASGCLKSFVAVDLCHCIVNRPDWAGHKVLNGDCVYIAAEDANGVIKRSRAYGQIGRMLLYRRAPIMGRKDDSVDEVIEFIKNFDCEPRLIVVDTMFETLFGGDPSKDGAAYFVANCKRLADEFDCLVLAVHHIGHDPKAARRPLGSAQLIGSFDVRIHAYSKDADALLHGTGPECGYPRSTLLTVQKAKNEGGVGSKFIVNVRRHEFGANRFSSVVSTLKVTGVVPLQRKQPNDKVEDAAQNEPAETVPPTPPVDSSEAILAAMVANPTASFSELMRVTGLSRGTLFRLVADLKAVGRVSRDGQTWVAGGAS